MVRAQRPQPTILANSIIVLNVWICKVRTGFIVLEQDLSYDQNVLQMFDKLPEGPERHEIIMFLGKTIIRACSSERLTGNSYNCVRKILNWSFASDFFDLFSKFMSSCRHCSISFLSRGENVLNACWSSNLREKNTFTALNVLYYYDCH